MQNSSTSMTSWRKRNINRSTPPSPRPAFCARLRGWTLRICPDQRCPDGPKRHVNETVSAWQQCDTAAYDALRKLADTWSALEQERFVKAHLLFIDRKALHGPTQGSAPAGKRFLLVEKLLVVNKERVSCYLCVLFGPEELEYVYAATGLTPGYCCPSREVSSEPYLHPALQLLTCQEGVVTPLCRCRVERRCESRRQDLDTNALCAASWMLLLTSSQDFGSAAVEAFERDQTQHAVSE
ncbi:hypothetical protein AOLI_G00176780 [Acnodon oligacanthus]